jgi:hypothetical protein
MVLSRSQKSHGGLSTQSRRSSGNDDELYQKEEFNRHCLDIINVYDRSSTRLHVLLSPNRSLICCSVIASW